MFENKLKLNREKTEFIVFGSVDKYKWLKDSFPLTILGNCLSPMDVVSNCAVLFDSKFSFTNQVNSGVSSCLDYAILCFAVCPPKISRGFRISKIA